MAALPGSHKPEAGRDPTEKPDRTGTGAPRSGFGRVRLVLDTTGWRQTFPFSLGLSLGPM